MKIQQKNIFFLILVLFSSCLGGGLDKRGMVRGASNTGTLSTHGGSFQIGKLDAEWQIKPFKKGAAYYRHLSGAAIEVTSFCKQSVDDSQLGVLANQIVYGLEDLRLVKQSELTLDQRDALRTHWVASLDGVKVFLDTVVIKKDGCVYDFVLIGPRQISAKVNSDFETFFTGFNVVKSPK